MTLFMIAEDIFKKRSDKEKFERLSPEYQVITSLNIARNDDFPISSIKTFSLLLCDLKNRNYRVKFSFKENHYSNDLEKLVLQMYRNNIIEFKDTITLNNTSKSLLNAASLNNIWIPLIR